MTEGKYLYSIIKGTEDRNFGSIGINNQEVSIIHFKDIAAVVSNIPVINFDRLDKKELTRHVAAHQKVNEEVIKDCDVIPMTFGIVAPSDSEVLSILERVYFQFKTALKKIKGKVEFVVQVFWDEKKILEELVKNNPEIQKLKKQSLTKGKIFSLPIKLKLGKLIWQKIDAARRSCLEDVKDTLNVLSHDFTSNKLINKEMLANFSFLIEKVREPELDKKMKELGEKYENKLRFKYIGPMPAYSFVDINLKLGNFELIDKARKLLGLPDEVSFEEIKKAYYQLSHQYHPDKHPDKTEEMKKITRAFEILENYCQGCDEFGEKNKGRKYSFRKEDVENSLIIKSKVKPIE